jgi:hypothetical protein
LDIDPTFGVFFMTKYSEGFRQQVVDEYLAGDVGTETLAARRGGDSPLLAVEWLKNQRLRAAGWLGKPVLPHRAETITLPHDYLSAGCPVAYPTRSTAWTMFCPLSPSPPYR